MEKLHDCFNSIVYDWNEIKVDKYDLLAQGEYNRNYIFVNPKDFKKYIIRVNQGSQIGLENQIKYEFNALKYMQKNQKKLRTPRVYYCDDSRKYIDNGVLIMEYIEGDYIDYDKTSINSIVECLADIHNINTSKSDGIFRKSTGAKDMIDECDLMFSKYDLNKISHNKHKDLFNKGIYENISNYVKIIKKMYNENNCKYRINDVSIINTDLNSTNFLVHDNYVKLIDWEKPCIGDSAQDLGHFLAPTTTYWKTDKIFNSLEIHNIIKLYENYTKKKYGIVIEDYEDRVLFYLKLNCLRGITWCSMALMDYYGHRDGEKIYNETTSIKLKEYICNMEELLVK